MSQRQVILIVSHNFNILYILKVEKPLTTLFAYKRFSVHFCISYITYKFVIDILKHPVYLATLYSNFIFSCFSHCFSLSVFLPVITVFRLCSFILFSINSVSLSPSLFRFLFFLLNPWLLLFVRHSFFPTTFSFSWFSPLTCSSPYLCLKLIYNITSFSVLLFFLSHIYSLLILIFC